MADISAAQVKELRDMTGSGIMDCKRALQESDGDIEKAVAWLREKGIAKAEKKSTRVAAEGAVIAKISDDKKSGVLVEINIETDFAANTDKFKAFTDAVATHILIKKPANIEELMAQPLYNDESKTVEVFQKEAIADIGENTSIRRFVIYEVEGNGAVAAYIHMGGKVGVFVEVTTDDDSVITKPEFADFAKNIGMQVASMRPNWVSEDEVPQAELDKEVEIIKNKALEEGKPEKIVMERIVPGQIKNFYKLNCLVDQEFFRDDDLTISQYIDQSIKAIGANVSVVRFTRYGLGEGIEKKVDDFAEEVRKQAGL
ncbi:MAG: elongation factor Ts [Clostridiales bacterium]|nr:elongation factor Ts [Clostridiales bacterium]